VSARNLFRKTTGGGRRGFALLALAVVGIMVFGMGFIGFVGAGQPQSGPPPKSAPPTPSASPTKPSASPHALSMKSSAPEVLSIPAMKVRSHLEVLGQKNSKYVDLPTKPSQPGWYKKSVTPGQIGIATIIGYIRRSPKVPGVFVHLNKLHKGDRMSISRKDKSTAVFAVDRVKAYSEKNFSSQEVYGQTKPRAEVRIITCGGTLRAGDPKGNVVVFAHLVDVAD
jgi:sortase (surface protein transpeptidase)